MNVLFVVAPDYPDMESVYERLQKGADTEHVTYRRKNDRGLNKIAEVLGIELPQALSEYDYADMAYVEEMLTRMDYVIVYGTPGSTVSGPWAEKATKYPYNLIFGHKVDLSISKPKATKGRKK